VIPVLVILSVHILSNGAVLSILYDCWPVLIFHALSTTQAYHVRYPSVVNVGGVVVAMAPLQSPVNAVSVLYITPVVRNQASASVLVPVAVAFVFLRLLFASAKTIAVGAVESTVNVGVVSCLFIPTSSVAVALSCTVALFNIGVVHVQLCSLFVLVQMVVNVVPLVVYASTMVCGFASIPPLRLIRYPELPLRYNPGYVMVISVGGVLSMLNCTHVKYALLPARSVASILSLAKVSKVFGNINVYEPSFAVPVVIFVVLTKLVIEYSNKMDVGLRFVSVPVFRVML